MIRSFYTVLAAIFVSAALVSAQGEKPTTPNPTTPPRAEPAQPAVPAQPGQQPAQPAVPAEPSPRATANKSANTVTYTGCIKPGTTAGTWILEGAEVAARPGASSPGAVGTSGTSKMAFDLDPAATVNLKAHANHRVELVGTLAPAKAPTDAPPASAAGASTAQTARQQFSVESLKMVSATCP